MSDILFLGAAGVAAGQPWLGAAAAAGAVLTAYVREFGRAEGLPADYRGPMGKRAASDGGADGRPGAGGGRAPRGECWRGCG